MFMLCVLCLISQSCSTLCDPMDHSLPGSSVHGNFQTRAVEWVAISFSRGSSQCGDRIQVSHISGRRFTLWATRETPSRCIKVKVVWDEGTLKLGRKYEKTGLKIPSEKGLESCVFHAQHFIFIYFKHVFIYWSFCAGSSLLHSGFLYLWQRLLSNHGARALELGSAVVMHGLSCLSCVIFLD